MDNNFGLDFRADIGLSLPLAIQIEITESCNFNCPFCYNNSGKRCEKSIFIDKWKNLLSYIVDLGGVFQCAFSGGEPLLYKDELLELMNILHRDKTGLVLITNAYFLDQAYIEKLCNYDWYWIQVSLDSYQSEVHDSLRGMKGSFDKAKEAIVQLKNYGLPVAISSVICNQNINDMDGIVELACDLGVDIVLFSPVLPVGRGVVNSNMQLNPVQLLNYNKEIEKVTEKYSPRILVRSAQSYENQMRNNNLNPPFGLLIRPNGDVKIDCLSPSIVGNVFETPIDTIWRDILREERWKNND